MADDDYEYRPKAAGGYQRRKKGSADEWQDSDGSSGDKTTAQVGKELGYKAGSASPAPRTSGTGLSLAEFAAKQKKEREEAQAKAAQDALKKM
jgi:hypothetical protein